MTAFGMSPNWGTPRGETLFVLRSAGSFGGWLALCGCGWGRILAQRPGVGYASKR